MEEVIDGVCAEPSLPVTVEMEEIVVSEEYGNEFFCVVSATGVRAAGSSAVDDVMFIKSIKLK